ncbi:hypothetical protein TOPH_02369 [Tolypocladium ophioglossoides CBS 100239]|uniref:Fungal STAND N-terminal Goodbye domain-containing protein n=1 Tax=Tolypocladium ophioglossoides (strain CBS 100239) TaxID=1163406 RepID=A0A0L0NG01_TOLOC|nr:hypothetical protein TOPH_02369 [Tolypocladium ophioglossoides CBS 100239]
MAKRKPTLSLLEMEGALGYKVDSFIGIGNIGHRFYSDLTPIVDGIYDRTDMEYRSLREAESSQYREEDAIAILPAGDEWKTISGDGDSIIVRRSNFAGFYKFLVDIQYGFGLDMPFLFTEAEAYGAVAVAQLCLRPEPTRSRTTLLNLPRELREKIYGFALHAGTWRTDEREYKFCRAIGDPSGLYFPFGDDCTLLRVNRQMRQEALPMAYRHTTFHLANIDDLTRLLIAVGRVGRENIESLDFSWESQIDIELNWRKFPDSENNHLILPALHVSATSGGVDPILGVPSEIRSMWQEAIVRYTQITGNQHVITARHTASVGGILAEIGHVEKLFIHQRYDGSKRARFRSLVSQSLVPIQALSEVCDPYTSNGFQIANSVSGHSDELAEFFQDVDSYLNGIQMWENQAPSVPEPKR